MRLTESGRSSLLWSCCSLCSSPSFARIDHARCSCWEVHSADARAPNDAARSAGLAAGHTPDRIRGIVAVNTFGWKPQGRAFRGMLALMGNPAMRQFDLATGLLARVTSTTFGVGRHLDAASRRAYRAGLTRSMGAFH